MLARRLVEMLVGFGLLGDCAYVLWTGTARGAYRRYDRATEPLSFWLGVLVRLVIGGAFLFGATSWRD